MRIAPILPRKSSQPGDAGVKGGADRAPTQDEETAAEKAAAEIDLKKVAEHEIEMQRLGADAKGEGRIP